MRCDVSLILLSAAAFLGACSDGTEPPVKGGGGDYAALKELQRSVDAADGEGAPNPPAVNRPNPSLGSPVSYPDFPPIQRALRDKGKVVWMDEDDRNGYRHCQSANSDMGDRVSNIGVYCTEVGSGIVKAYDLITDSFYDCLPNASSCGNAD